MNKGISQSVYINSSPKNDHQLNTQKISPHHDNITTSKNSSTFPSIMKKLISSPYQPHQHSKNQQLNNEGCLCQLCQRIILQENQKIIHKAQQDLYSEQYHSQISQEKYLHLIQEISAWTYLYKKRASFFRFCLPEICIYEHGHPVCLIQKKTNSQKIHLIRNKSRLHFFEIQSFFLSGYLYHQQTTADQLLSQNGSNKKLPLNKRQIDSRAYHNECILFAKYRNNTFRMLTYNQIENLFRSKNKYMKDGLMYLQTILGGKEFNVQTVKVDLDEVMRLKKNNDSGDINGGIEVKEEDMTSDSLLLEQQQAVKNSKKLLDLWQRAKTEVKIIINEIKMTDPQFYPQKQQIEFENQLKQSQDTLQHYLTYLSYKIILLSSKNHPNIYSKSTFRYSIVQRRSDKLMNGGGFEVYLFDFRVEETKPSQNYWESSVVKALELKLQKTMKMMQLDTEETTDNNSPFLNTGNSSVCMSPSLHLNSNPQLSRHNSVSYQHQTSLLPLNPQNSSQINPNISSSYITNTSAHNPRYSYGMIDQNNLSKKARELSDWLKSSTKEEWAEMHVIKRRLQRLEQEKKSLERSKQEQMMKRNFKVRSMNVKKIKEKNGGKVDLHQLSGLM